MAVYDDGLATDHGKDIAFWTNAGAGGAPNAVIVIDVWMLGLRPFRKQFPLLGGVARADFPFLQAFEIDEQEDEANDPANAVR